MSDHPDTDQQRPQDDRRGLSQCGVNLGWHAYTAGPCFDTREQARVYRDGLDRDGITWRPQT